MNTISNGERAEGSVLDRILWWVVLAGVCLTPLVFIPLTFAPLQIGKMILLYAVVLVGSCLWILRKLRSGTYTFSFDPLIISFVAIPVVAILSALFSGWISLSFFGQAGEIGSGISILALSVLALLMAGVCTSKQRILYVYMGFFGVSALLCLFHVSRLFFGASFLSFSLFTTILTNVIGGFNDIAVFFGLLALFLVATLELLNLSKLVKAILYIFLILALFLMAVIGFPLVWYVIGILSLIFFVYLLSMRQMSFAGSSDVEESLTEDDQPFKMSTPPFAPLLVVFIAFAAILGGAHLSNALETHFNIPGNLEGRPSWSATLDVTRSIVASHPIVGTGPGSFTKEWDLYKPLAINNSVFWNSDFGFGVGVLPTLAGTTGILGIIVWLAFLLLLLYAGIRSLFTRISDPFSRYVLVSSFLIVVYLLIFSISYTPSAALTMLTFFFIGLMFAVMIQAGVVSTFEFNMFDNQRASFVASLSLIALLLATVALGYVVVERIAASLYFGYGNNIVSATTIDQAESYFQKAAALAPIDSYFRSTTQAEIIRLNTLSSDTTLSADAARTKFQGIFATAKGASDMAISVNTSDYQNYLNRASFYETLLSLGFKDAGAPAQADLQSALVLNPKDPAIPLEMARANVLIGSTTEAIADIKQALALKPDYTDAIFLLAQIQANAGDLPSAIASVQTVADITPTDPGVFFQLGLLQYDDKDYTNAAGAFEQAISLNPQYQNAMYFLGLSDYQIGQNDAAIDEFQTLVKLNPDNTDLAAILKNLQAGVSPFANEKAPVTAPQNAKNPPVPEKQ